MTISQDTIRSKFKACGLKVTPQRTAIYKALAETTSHPTAETLFQHVSQEYPMISLNTVYYTLSTLKDAGLLKDCLLYTSPSPRDGLLSRMPSSA